MQRPAARPAAATATATATAATTTVTGDIVVGSLSAALVSAGRMRAPRFIDERQAFVGGGASASAIGDSLAARNTERRRSSPFSKLRLHLLRVCVCDTGDARRRRFTALAAASRRQSAASVGSAPVCVRTQAPPPPRRRCRARACQSAAIHWLHRLVPPPPPKTTALLSQTKSPLRC